MEKLDAIRSLRIPDPNPLGKIEERLFRNKETGQEGVLQLKAYRILPLGDQSFPALLNELEMATRRRLSEGGDDSASPRQFQRRAGATAWALKEAEDRLGCSLPLEYKRVLQLTNGWTCRLPFTPC